MYYCEQRLKLYLTAKEEMQRFLARLDRCIEDEKGLKKDADYIKERDEKLVEFRRTNPNGYLPDNHDYVRCAALNRGALKRGSLDLAQVLLRLRK